jgi:hypothetical protein
MRAVVVADVVIHGRDRGSRSATQSEGRRTDRGLGLEESMRLGAFPQRTGLVDGGGRGAGGGLTARHADGLR